jgi:acetoin utilization deacetylase AcuC-like enzyme
MTKLQITYSDDYLKWNLGSGDGSHPTKPIRAKIATELLVDALGDSVDVITPTVDAGDRERVESVHDADYVSEVLDKYESWDWTGKSQDNAETALKMFAGTARLTENILEDKINIGFNPQGAKHHAAYANSSGFCVFNDMAWSAREFRDAGLKPLYLDWDVHAGDGVQNLLEDTDIPTLSIHGSGIFPRGMGNHAPDMFGETHTWHNPEKHFYNWNIELGSGDDALMSALIDAERIVAQYQPDVILLATGADGHEGEYWGMKWTLGGYAEASNLVSSWADKFLIGGAGGYQAKTWTPAIWATVVENIYNNAVA